MWIKIRPFVRLGVLGFLTVYFGFQALTGERGLLNSGERERELAERTAQLAALREEHQELQVRARLLRQESLSADLLDERAFTVLGLARPDEVIVSLPAVSQNPPSRPVGSGS